MVAWWIENGKASHPLSKDSLVDFTSSLAEITQTAITNRRLTAPLTICFSIHRCHAPAFKSSVEEWSNEIGGRLAGTHSFAKEEALTAAAVAFGALRAAVSSQIAFGDEAYA